MKPWAKIMLVLPLLGLVSVIGMRCGSDSTVNTELEHRFHVFTARDGALAPAAVALEPSNDRGNDIQAGIYTLTLENLSNPLILYSAGQQHNTIETTFSELLSLWAPIFGGIPPHATLHAHLNSSGENEELFLELRDPEYDEELNRITFNVSVLNSTLENLNPNGMTYFNNIKVTVLDHNRNDGFVSWTLAQGARHGYWVSNPESGVYKLYLNYPFDHVYALSHAPDKWSHKIPGDLFIDSWHDRFGDTTPTAYLTSYDLNGQIRIQAMTLSEPVIDMAEGQPSTTQLVFQARLLHGDANNQQPWPYRPC